MEKPKYKIVEVEWLDAQFGFSRIIESNEVENIESINTFSIGYLMREEKEFIVLSFMVYSDSSFKHWQLIPRGMIKKIREIKLKNESSKII